MTFLADNPQDDIGMIIVAGEETALLEQNLVLMVSCGCVGSDPLSLSVSLFVSPKTWSMKHRRLLVCWLVLLPPREPAKRSTRNSKH